MQTITLPWPTSANRLWRKARLSAEYKAWKRTAWVAIAQQRPAKFKGPVAIHLQACPPDARLRDPDNIVKPIFDSLVDNGVISGDDFGVVKFHSVSQGPRQKGGAVVVTIADAAALPAGFNPLKEKALA